MTARPKSMNPACRTSDFGLNDRQTFSAIALDRRSETLLRNQDVPASSAGVTGSWSASIGSTRMLMAVDARRNRGTTNETGFSADGGTTRVSAGGTADNLAVSGQAARTVGARLLATVGARVDFFAVRPAGNRFRAFSPRAAVLWQAKPRVAFRASAFQAFRAPTLNELYRDFRVGNILTLHNAALAPERFTGIEGAVSFAVGTGAIRVVAHGGRLNGAITNVTRSRTPGLIVRQRDNAGRINARGLELEAELTLFGRLLLNGAAAITNSRFGSDSDALAGHLVPLVSRSQFAGTARYVAPRMTAGVSIRANGAQFEDDLNELPLGRAVITDVFASRTLTRPVSLFAAIENLFNEEYDVGRTPVRAVGLPRTVRAGVRVMLGR